MKEIIHSDHSKDSEHKRLLVFALDSSDCSKYAVDWSKKHLLKEDDKIIIVNIRAPVEPSAITSISEKTGLASLTEKAGINVPYIKADPEKDEKLNHVQAKEQKQLLDCYAKCFEECNLEYFGGVGDPYKDLLDFIDTLKCDLIVIGQRGEGVLKSVLGGVSDFVVNHSKDPVLVVKKK
ncbi:hypothetical protein HK103_001631 [Boothiomyces macroporosus]|uniref:UspA domain-containing protein n=1 Tax=Boothiomyces macroporosus TaxID=261099 RepID=A0AAD5UAM0_9FUNG|nr:hypothetical protein HK103_001631 [Boothiomyces macroporosus]